MKTRHKIKTTAKNVLEVAMEVSLPRPLLERVQKAHGPRLARAVAMASSMGGIGPLVNERLEAQAELGLNVVGVFLLYERVWMQDWSSWTSFSLKSVDVGTVLRSVLCREPHSFNVTFFDGHALSVQVYSCVLGKSKLYFLSCPEVTNVVYPCEVDAPSNVALLYGWGDYQRQRQSWLLGRGALALCQFIGFKPQVTVMSETPAGFVHHRLINDGFTQSAYYKSTRYVFNDHTPLEYAHPVWPENNLFQVKMNAEIYRPFLNPKSARARGERRIDVTQLLVALSDGVFGVSRKHGDVMREMPSLKKYAKKIKTITNGVRVKTWQHPSLSVERSLSDEQLVAAKEKIKTDFWPWLKKRSPLWALPLKEVRQRPLLLWTRRITGYKRLDVLTRLLSQTESRDRFIRSGIVLVVGGRLYQRDEQSEAMMTDLRKTIKKHEALKKQVVLFDNFNVWEAPTLYQAADGAVMLSNDGKEASATGFMKAQLNGAVVLASPDGAVVETVRFKKGKGKALHPNGLLVPYTPAGEPKEDAFLNRLEEFGEIVKKPILRAAWMRAALSAEENVSIERTAADMTDFYERLK